MSGDDRHRFGVEPSSSGGSSSLNNLRFLFVSSFFFGVAFSNRGDLRLFDLFDSKCCSHFENNSRRSAGLRTLKRFIKCATSTPSIFFSKTKRPLLFFFKITPGCTIFQILHPGVVLFKYGDKKKKTGAR